MPSPLDSEQSVFKDWWAKCECNGELRFVRVVASAAFQEPIPCIWADHEVGEAPREASSANGKNFAIKQEFRGHCAFVRSRIAIPSDNIWRSGWCNH